MPNPEEPQNKSEIVVFVGKPDLPDKTEQPIIIWPVIGTEQKAEQDCACANSQSSN